MKLYNENMPAPNPRRVRIFLAEKGIEIPLERVALVDGKHKSPEYLTKNSLGQVPTLELDDGSTISESVSICRYLEALHPKPALFGATPKEQGLIDMWIRRSELRVMMPIGQVWMNSHPFTKPLLEAQGIKRFEDFGEANKERSLGAMRWLDKEIGGRPFIAGDTYSMADIVTLCTIDFAKFIDLPMPDDCKHLRAWHTRVSSRPSATA
jgi:glutathione S-transferase